MHLLYTKTGDQKNALATIVKIVQVDPAYKKYQLTLAEIRVKQKKPKHAIKHYEQWVSRNPKDKKALEDFYVLAQAAKDTSRLLNITEMLTRIPNTHSKYRYAFAEIKFLKLNDLQELRELVKKNPKYKNGRKLLVKHYLKENNITKLLPYENFMALESKQDKTLLPAYAEVLANKKKFRQANTAYYQALAVMKKDKKFFRKVLVFSVKHKSPHLKSVLEHGYKNYPQDLDVKYQYAKSLGQTDKALAVIQEVLKSDPGRLEAVQFGAETAVKLKKTSLAIKMLNNWTRLNPTDSKPWGMLVEIYQAKKDTTRLVSALQKMGELSPNDHKIAFRTGVIFKQIKKNTPARDYLQRAVDMAPKNTRYQRELGLVLVASKQYGYAKKYLLAAYSPKTFDEEVSYGLYKVYRAEKNTKESIKHLRALAGKKPTQKKYAYPLAKLEAKAGNPKRVITILENPTLKPKLSARMSFLLLKAYVESKQSSKAASYGMILTRKFPKQAGQSSELAILFYHQKKTREAREILDKLVRTKPSQEVFYYKGRIEFDKRNWKEAVKHFKKAEGYSKEVNDYLGQSYSNLKQYKKAIIAYENYYRQVNQKTLLPKLYDLYKKSKDSLGIHDILERLVKAYPANLDYKADLAAAYLARGETQKAVSQFQVILKKRPTNAKANLYMGIANARSNKCKSAVKQLNIGLKKHSDNPEGWKLLGNCQLRLKQKSSALNAFKKAFKLNPKDYDVAIEKMKLTKSLRRTSELPQAYADVVKVDSNHVEATSALAKIEHKKKNYKAAEALYKRVVNHTQDNKNVWANYAQVLLEMKKVRQARDAFQRAVDLGATGVDIKISLARIYIEDGNAEQAEKLLKDIVFKKKSYHQAYLWLAQIALKRNQSGVAEDYLQQAMKYAPGNVEYREALAGIYFKEDKFKEVVSILNSVKSKLKSKAHIQYAQSLMKTGKVTQAFNELKVINEKNPTAMVVASLADLYVAKQMPKQALAVVKKSKFKNKPAVQLALAKAHIALGEFAPAQQLVMKLLSRDNTNAEYYYLYGLCLYKQTRYAEAKKEFNKALQYKAHYPEAIYQLGMCELKAKKIESAKDLFTQLKSNKKRTLAAQGYLGLAQVFERERKYEAMAHHLEKSVGLATSIEAMYRLTIANIYLKKAQEAKKWSDKAQALDAESHYAIMAKTELLLAQGRKSEAMRIIKKARTDYPNSCELLLTFIKANWIMGYAQPVKSVGSFVIKKCPDMEMVYYYMGMVAHRFFDKKEAKKQFKLFVKYGGDASLLPKGY
jgi:tetratricopeptide (TPR) repeat protein